MKKIDENFLKMEMKINFLSDQEPKLAKMRISRKNERMELLLKLSLLAQILNKKSSKKMYNIR